MRDDLSEDQRVLLDASVRFIENECPLQSVRERVFDDAEFAAHYRRQAGELGWYSMLVPEAQGGGSVSGNGAVDLALVAAARGAALQPDPFVGPNVVAYALAAAGTDQHRSDVLPAVLSGEQSAAWGGSTPPGRPALDGAVEAAGSGDALELSGRLTWVQDADAATWLLVSARTEAGPSQFLVPMSDAGVTVIARDGLDVTRRFFDVDLAGVRVGNSHLVGDLGGAADLLASELAIACMLTVAESVGAMQHEFDMAVQYAKDRIAFGRPIGSFQAVKHLLADTSLQMEMSTAIVDAAAERVGGSAGYGLEAASMAKAFVGDSGIDLAQNCFQVFGGIGFTWEHDQHLYLRRLTTNAEIYGEPAWHREYLCQLAEL